ncbi:ell-associated factor Eaf-like isoform X2 [Tripterygium wilfordii]|uniref:ell-associated factor Eaf-like isoform X2 n=1 Tax=Tripterygium wilfordii TaxID=458696 RepID=UPI0018F83699|nr:ell-associated factor Eaf-like isoform X2 [Tripterygium wilfordii]
MANNAKEEPKNAPKSDQWYTLSLGPSFNDDTSNKYCTLRYEFKPASIDKTKPGSLNKNKDNRVSLEFQNNQAGKPKVAFEGCSEDHKENDAVLYFDGETFRLERLHRAFNQLRRLRLPGESAPPVESRLSPAGKASKSVNIGRSSIPPVPVEVERIDIGEPEIPGAGKGVVAEFVFDQTNVSAASPGPKNDETEDHQDIDIDDLFGADSPVERNPDEQKVDGGFDINVRHDDDTDDEIADVDDSGDEADKGRNAAEALRAQMKAVEREKQTSTSSGSSASSGSGSSSSSDSEGSDGDTVNSI